MSDVTRLLNAIDEGRFSFEDLKDRIAEGDRRPSTRSLRRYLAVLADAGYFEAVAFTDEDRARNERYAANASRESLRDLSQSVDEFLAGFGRNRVACFPTVFDVKRDRLADVGQSLFTRVALANTARQGGHADDITAVCFAFEHDGVAH